MRIIIIAFALLFGSLAPLRAQDSTRLDRYGYVIGASLAYSLFDYVGFNLTKEHSTVVRDAYRGIQVATQIAISYFLYKTLGLTSAISFNLIWWTWNDDLAYYGWANALNPHHPPWENRTDNGLMLRDIDWAGWTPIGLLRPYGTNIARSTLIAQAMIGLTVSLAILW